MAAISPGGWSAPRYTSRMTHDDDRRRFLRTGVLAAAGFTVAAESRLLFARSRKEGPTVRDVKLTKQAKPTLEGAGVHLHRAFGFGETEPFDPFLLFDDFRNDDPARFEKGFPWHPHRGIETITYVLAGTVSFLMGDEWVEAPAGTFILVPGGVTHDFRNCGDERAGMLNIGAPGGFEGHMPAIVEWFEKHPLGDA